MSNRLQIEYELDRNRLISHIISAFTHSLIHRKTALNIKVLKRVITYPQNREFSISTIALWVDWNVTNGFFLG